MKFFTPELLDRFGSEDDDIADAAQEEWEQAIVRYRSHIQSFWPALPAPFREMFDTIPLHDAQVVRWEATPSAFLVELILDPLPRQKVVFTYAQDGRRPALHLLAVR